MIKDSLEDLIQMIFNEDSTELKDHCSKRLVFCFKYQEPDIMTCIEKYDCLDLIEQIFKVIGDGGILLHYAIENNYIRLVKFILENSKNSLNEYDRWVNTPLHYTHAYNRLEILKIMIENDKIDVNIVDEYGRNCFTWTCADGNTSMVKIFLDSQRVDPNSKDFYGWTPFHLACENNHLDIVKILIEDPHVDINAENIKLFTPLDLACWHGNIDVVKILLDDPRININHVNSDNETCFLCACHRKQAEVVRLLLDDCRIDERLNISALNLALKIGDLDLIKVILNDYRFGVKTLDQHKIREVIEEIGNGKEINDLISEYF